MVQRDIARDILRPDRLRRAQTAHSTITRTHALPRYQMAAIFLPPNTNYYSVHEESTSSSSSDDASDELKEYEQRWKSFNNTIEKFGYNIVSEIFCFLTPDCDDRREKNKRD
ncbi:hypothetical protein PROFUN_00271 [Planoprotostelium fungivorum]|uniref:Uncharacterized protein n=1 Tax=Planoprotostelium fungivorum TaxID=1890364 RepID=A0A2P6NXW8_9EUKA|nr:hypothetical protein PROFUN_00271 [Planoprotostelium fungivorum]